MLRQPVGNLCWQTRGSDITEILGDLCIQKVGDAEWKLLSPIEFRFNNGRIVIAERGFTFDGGSIPSVFQSIVPCIGSSADLAWVCHDRCYAGHRNGETHITRLEADEWMLELLEHLSVPGHIAYGAFTAVRAAGLAAWETEEERQEREYRIDDTFLDQ